MKEVIPPYFSTLALSATSIDTPTDHRLPLPSAQFPLPNPPLPTPSLQRSNRKSARDALTAVSFDKVGIVDGAQSTTWRADAVGLCGGGM